MNIKRAEAGRNFQPEKYFRIQKMAPPKNAIIHEQQAISDNPQAYVDNLLAVAKSPKDRAKRLMECQIVLGEISDSAIDTIVEVQKKIESERTWNILGIEKKEMWKRIRYFSIVRPAIEKYNHTQNRKKRWGQVIEKNWTPDWRSIVDPQKKILPSHESEHFLSVVRRICHLTTISRFLGIPALSIGAVGILSILTVSTLDLEAYISKLY
jgi:hypothetical protein